MLVSMMRTWWSMIYRWHPLLWRSMKLNDKEGTRISHIKIGKLGERMAAIKLRAEGRKILYRNYRGTRGGEIDIVARDRDVLTFVEVKTRKKRMTGRPLDAVTPEKQKYIKRGAQSWLNMLKTEDFQWRYDVVEVELTEGKRPEITVINGAFD